MMSRLLIFVAVGMMLSGCLVTRSEIGEADQNAVYGKKMADNQADAQQTQAAKPPQANEVVPTQAPDEKDELIRNLNGRIEELENLVQKLQKDGAESVKAIEARMTILQESIAKLTGEQQSNAEAEQKAENSDELKSSDEAEVKKSKTAKLENKNKPDKIEKLNKKLGSYEEAEQLFSKQEWKLAILGFNKYADENPKGKHVPDAKFKIGVCFQELGMKDEAVIYFEEVAANYAKTEAGKKSKARLAKLKK